MIANASTTASNIVSSNGAVTGGVRSLLRFEGLSIFAAATTAYVISGGNLWLFAALFFTPDLSFAFYTVGPRLGGAAYNFVHSYATALALGAIGWFAGTPLVWQLALILGAHAGLDRAVGYGLKYATAFNQTHLGRIGRDK